MLTRLVLGYFVTVLLQILCTTCRVPRGQGKLEKVSEFEWSGKGQGKIFFCRSEGKVRENEKLVTPDVRFSG